MEAIGHVADLDHRHALSMSHVAHIVTWLTDPIALVLGAGFALPFLLAGVPIRAALILAGHAKWR
jgi:hypothetical protein